MLLDDLLRTAGDVPDPDQRDLDAARRRLRPARPLWQRPMVLAAAAGVAALALVLPVAGVPGSGGSEAEAAVVLRQAARAAAAQPGGWPDAPYWWVQSQNDCNGRQTEREIWLGHEEPGVLKDTQFPGEPTVPLDVARFATGGSDVDWDELYALPTDPARLEQHLRDGIEGAGPDDDTEMFVIVGDLLRESPAPPALRAALYEVAARVPGVRREGPAADAIGRAGQAVSRGDRIYVFDTSDGRLLEDRAPGCRLTFLASGPATQPGVRP